MQRLKDIKLSRHVSQLWLVALIVVASLTLASAEKEELDPAEEMRLRVEAGPLITEAVGVSTAATLIGAISFIMCLYYFLNYPDPDVKQMAWTTVSSTISIFCAVLLFSSFNDLTQAYITTPLFGKDEESMGALGVAVGHMLFWIIFTQIVLALTSGAAGPRKVDLSEASVFTRMCEEEQEIVKQSYECNMACYAVLCAHITGFASINAFGRMQMVFFSDSPAWALGTPVAVLVFSIILQRITYTVREWYARGVFKADQKDTFEKLWDKECCEAENDVMGLSLSFTTVSALRYFIDGCLPDPEGQEHCHGAYSLPKDYLWHHTFWQKVLMMSLGVAFTLIIFIIRAYWPEWLEEDWIKEIKLGDVDEKGREWTHSRKRRLKLTSRLAEGIYVGITMAFSWCFFFGTQMVLAGFRILSGQKELLAVSNALVLSIVSMCLIIPLDALADLPDTWTDAKTDRAIRSIISSMGLLIGFGWEQCFDASVDVLAETTEKVKVSWINPQTTKLTLTLFCAALLVPAWKWYIVPFIIEEGWEPEYPLKAVYKIGEEEEFEVKEQREATKNALRDSVKLVNDYIEKEEKLTPEQRGKMNKWWRKVGEAAARARHREIRAEEGDIEGGASPNASQGLGLAHYELLAGDESGEVKKLRVQVANLQDELAKAKGTAPVLPAGSQEAEIARLRAELEKAKGTSQQAQAMLDSTVDRMMGTMKQMNGTIGRIEINSARGAKDKENKEQKKVWKISESDA